MSNVSIFPDDTFLQHQEFKLKYAISQSINNSNQEHTLNLLQLQFTKGSEENRWICVIDTNTSEENVSATIDSKEFRKNEDERSEEGEEAAPERQLGLFLSLFSFVFLQPTVLLLVLERTILTLDLFSCFIYAVFFPFLLSWKKKITTDTSISLHVFTLHGTCFWSQIYVFLNSYITFRYITRRDNRISPCMLWIRS